MATIQDRETFGRARLSFAQRDRTSTSSSTLLAQFESGEIGPDEWRAFRLLRGTYGQRQTGDAQMLRIKIPQGILTRDQLDAVADVAERYSRGFGHITTRQNIQLHFVKLHDAEPAMRELAAAGMTTREACGNSVRNITACPYSGVAADEAFDVTPYAEGADALPAASSAQLRRCRASSRSRSRAAQAIDHIGSAINDIGWNARVQTIDGREVRGFKVTVAGGTATMTRAGNLLHEFLPVEEMFDCAEAIIRVFHRLGDYKHKQKNRLKFLVKSLGWDGFSVEYERERAELLPGAAALPFDPSRPPVEERAGLASSAARSSLEEIAARATATAVIGPGIVPKVEPRLTVQSRGVRRVVAHERAAAEAGWLLDRHRHDGARRPDVGTDAACLASSPKIYGDGTIRVTMDQNLLFRWVRNENVEAFYKSLAAAGFARPGAGTLSDVTSCPGAESCKLAVTQSRGLGRVLSDHLLERPDHRRRVRRHGHQDQRLPERLRSAPHRRHRLPGQLEEGRQAAGAAVLRDGRRRLWRRHHDVRPAGGEGPRAPLRARARSPREAVSGSARRAESPLAFFRRVDLARSRRCSAISSA